MKIDKKQGGILGGTAAVLLSAAIALFSPGGNDMDFDNFKGDLIQDNTYTMEQKHEYLTNISIDLNDTVYAGTAELVVNDEIVEEVMVQAENKFSFKCLPVVVKPLKNLQLRLKTDDNYIAVGQFNNDGTLDLIVKEGFVHE